jgi:hypothetical protein
LEEDMLEDRCIRIRMCIHILLLHHHHHQHSAPAPPLVAACSRVYHPR